MSLLLYNEWFYDDDASSAASTIEAFNIDDDIDDNNDDENIFYAIYTLVIIFNFHKKITKLIKNDIFFSIVYYHTMPNIWCIINGVLHTTNNGYDKNEKPIIPFLEFL